MRKKTLKIKTAFNKKDVEGRISFSKNAKYLTSKGFNLTPKVNLVILGKKLFEVQQKKKLR